MSDTTIDGSTPSAARPATETSADLAEPGTSARAGAPAPEQHGETSTATDSDAFVEIHTDTVDTVDTDDAERASDGEARRWRRAVTIGLIAYVVSRLCVLAGAAVRASQVVVDQRNDGEPEQGAIDLITGVLTSWDGLWYLTLARSGYPTSIPADITFNQPEARAAFFPLYPGAVNVVDRVLPGGDTFAALTLNLVLGSIAVVLVGMLARSVFSTAVAARAMVLMAVFPGSFVLSFAYSEALFLVFAAACLLLLHDERWFLAGLAGALATATRPNGIAIVAACLVAAVIAVWTKRQWSAISSVLLAPVGFVAFQLYVDDTAGESGAWFRVQREAWSEGTSFGITAVTNTVGFLRSPFDSPADALTFLSLFALAIMVFAAWKRRLPPAWIAFSAVVIALMLIPETVTARPRFVYTAFPLLVAVAAWWPRPSPEEVRSGDDQLSLADASWYLMVGLSCAGLAVLTNLYGVFGAIP
ncbi:MAG: hypothetical protein AB8G26_03725 [Ilumatobacter sp.]